MLARSVEQGADAIRVADAMATMWRAVDAALAPIIGKLGVAALYKRSVHVTAAAHPSLAALPANLHGATDPAALTSLLARQDLASAAAAGDALLQNFCDLLATLIGPALAERLLDPVWVHLPSGIPAQDSSP